MTTETNNPQDTSTEAAEAAQDATEAQETPQDTTAEDQAPDDGSKAGKEAAKYRRQLRETEAERDALAQRVETLQRAEAERIAGETVTRPAALWAAGIELPDLLDADGNVDPHRVREAVRTAAESLGLARASRTPKPDPSQGAHGHGAPANQWETAMRV